MISDCRRRPAACSDLLFIVDQEGHLAFEGRAQFDGVHIGCVRAH